MTAIKAAHTDKIVFADLKTMDAGELEAETAFAAGADLVTVLGAAGDSTIIGVIDKDARAKQIVEFGVEFVEMHAGLDEQAEEGFTFATLLRDGEASGVPFSVAGGITVSTSVSVQQSGAVVAVAGGAIYSALDVAAAAAAMRAAIIRPYRAELGSGLRQ